MSFLSKIFGQKKPNIEKLKQNGDVEGLIQALDYYFRDQSREGDVEVLLGAAKALSELGDTRATEALKAKRSALERSAETLHGMHKEVGALASAAAVINKALDENKQARQALEAALAKLQPQASRSDKPKPPEVINLPPPQPASQAALAVLEAAYLVRHDEEVLNRINEALDTITAQGETGIRLLGERLTKDLSVSGSSLRVGFGGEFAHNEWLKLRQLVRALGRSQSPLAIEKLAPLLALDSDINQYYDIFQPALIEAMGAVGSDEAIEHLKKAIKSRFVTDKSKGILQNILERREGAVSEINTPDEHGYTQLHRAVEAGDKATVEGYLADGAKIDTHEKYHGETPLHTAVVKGQIEIIQLLLAKGAQVDSRANDDRTPLHVAAAKGASEIAVILIAGGANVNAKTQAGRTPLWWAENNMHDGVADLLRKHGGV